MPRIRKRAEEDRVDVPESEEEGAEDSGLPQSFSESAASLTEAEWERARVYVYRLAPKMDTGGKAYIGKFDRPIDESELLASFGSGRYLLILNDGRGRVLAKTTNCGQ